VRLPPAAAAAAHVGAHRLCNPTDMLETTSTTQAPSPKPSHGPLQELMQHKLVFIETTDVLETTLALDNFRRACDCGRGAAFFSVARGKVRRYMHKQPVMQPDCLMPSATRAITAAAPPLSPSPAARCVGTRISCLA